LNVGVIPVVNDGSVCGVLTDRDIVLRALAEKRDPKKTKVQDIMSQEVVFCNENDEY
jgi:CBS domain-containing protein